MLIVGAAQPLVMQARRLRHAALYDNAAAIADAVVARRAKDIVLRAAARQQFGRQRLAWFCLFIGALQVAAGDRSRGPAPATRLPSRNSAARLIFVVLRLRVHVRARAARDQNTNRMKMARRIMLPRVRPKLGSRS